MKNARVLFISQEITPYLPESELSVIGRYLPQGIQDKGKEIRTFMPRFGSINERRNQLHEVIRLSGMNLIISDTDHPLIIKVASIQSARMQVYFIDNDDYFHRKNAITEDDGTYFSDNDERMIFFARGVLETVRKLRWVPDIVHCHGWFTAAAPLYVKKAFKEDPIFSHSKVVYSVYNDEYPDTLAPSFKSKLLTEGVRGKDVELAATSSWENVTKLALQYSDAAIIGSKTINPTISSFLEQYNKPVLGFEGPDTYLDAYSNFYDELINTTKAHGSTKK